MNYIPTRWMELFQSAVEAVRMRITPLERQVAELNAQVEQLLAAQGPALVHEVPHMSAEAAQRILDAIAPKGVCEYEEPREEKAGATCKHEWLPGAGNAERVTGWFCGKGCGWPRAADPVADERVALEITNSVFTLPEDLRDRETPMTGTRRETAPTLDLSKPSAPRCCRPGCREPALPHMSLCAGCSS